MTQQSFFNELCIKEEPLDYSVITHFRECYNNLRKNNFTICRVSHDKINTVLEKMCLIPGVSRNTIMPLLLTFFHSPFEPDTLSEQQGDDFLSHTFIYKNLQPEGFSWAAFYKTLSFSLCSSDEWNTDVICIIQDGKKTNVHHVSTTDHIFSQQSWFDDFKEITLQTCQLLPKDKKVALRDDHGKDVLKTFWDRISQNEYVVCCLNSLPFNSSEKDFIHALYDDGKIELVLTWEDKGYGMLIQTTGRNRRETQKIADILKEKYAK